MKFFAIFLLAIVSIFALNFFIPESEDTEKRLIMRAYVFDESVTDPNDWQGEDVFAFDELEVGKPRFAAPTAGAGIHNINIEFEYDGGVVEAYSEDMQISIGNGHHQIHAAYGSNAIWRHFRGGLRRSLPLLRNRADFL